MFRSLADTLAGLLGPWEAWGLEYSPSDARLVRMVRRPSGWVLDWKESDTDSGLERWAKARHFPRTGWRLALGAMPLFHFPPEESAPVIENPPEDLEECPDPATPSRWRFLWRPCHLEHVSLAWEPLTFDSIHPVPALFATMLDPSKTKGFWIACRTVQGSGQVWLMEGVRICHYMDLQGGRQDPALLEREWKEFLQALPTDLPAWSQAPLALLDFADAECFPAPDREHVQAPWALAFQAIPERYRFAAAVALPHPQAALEEDPFGPLDQARLGRSEAAGAILAGLGALILCVLVCLGVWAYSLRVRAEESAVGDRIAKMGDRLQAYDRNRNRMEQAKAWNARVTGQILLGSQMATLAACWPRGAWVEEWTGSAGTPTGQQSLVVWSSEGDQSVTRCLDQAKTGMKVQGTETWSQERWQKDRNVTVPMPLLRLSVRTEVGP
ncbi:MAG: hypothetical protein IPN71_13710 [Fibrobacteres bacterium]|nr:hypothetical protein [Fibrobacterota bacterium]